MRLHFNRAGVERLIRHALEAKSHRAAFDEAIVKPALWLVGDDGVYLLSNGLPMLMAHTVRDEGMQPKGNNTLRPEPLTKDTNFVVYAAECDPLSLDFNKWWAAKQASFGGDDGIDTFDVIEIQKALRTYRDGDDLILDITPQKMAIVEYVSTVKAPKKVKRA